MKENIRPNSSEQDLFLLGCATHCNSNDVLRPHNNPHVDVEIEVQKDNA